MAAKARKLFVEVVEARELLPKDGTGTSSPYVVADFDGQQRRTQTICRNLNPTWHEVLEFNVSSSSEFGGELLVVDVLHDRRVGPSRRNNSLGRIQLGSIHFVRKGEEALIHFSLEKKSFFSWVKGDIGLRIYYDDVPVTPLAVDAGRLETDEQTERVTKSEKRPEEETKQLTKTDNEAAATLMHDHVKHEERFIPLREKVERSSYDLVDRMQYLFVRVVKARSLPSDAQPHVRVAAYSQHATTGIARRSSFFEWDQTFAFSSDRTTGDSILEISVWNLPPETGGSEEQHFLGGVCFDIADMPVRDLPDGPLAPQWYRLEGAGDHRGDIMLATWVGTQADESFANAWKADVSQISSSKIYLSPKLWYLRVTVLEAHETPIPTREISLAVRATLGFQIVKTRAARYRNNGPIWNEDLLFVAAEPFGEDESLVLLLESKQGKETSALGSTLIPLSSIERRVDDREVTSRWLDLLPSAPLVGERRGQGGRLHVRVCLDGGYHVQDEPLHAASDNRPSARQLWRPVVGTVELGVIGCRGLLPMKAVDGKGATDAFAVAKYGPKWARTRTITHSFAPAWNEQFSWPVYDPSTVLTLAVFDDVANRPKQSATACRPLGRIRIRISTLDANRSYRCCYPLLLLVPSGLKLMGEIEIAVRFTRSVSQIDLLHLYAQPIVPIMHYILPIASAQRESLRIAAARVSAAHLARAEPSLRREVVIWLLEASDPAFSMRRIRANWKRIAVALSWIRYGAHWVSEIRQWRNSAATITAHGVALLLIWFPDLFVPAAALYLGILGVWRYKRRLKAPAAGMAARESGADGAEREELDEEFDAVPSARGEATVRARYERARTVGAMLQGLLGDAAAQAERVQALVSWRDPRATAMFIMGCFVMAVVMYVVPARLVAVTAILYYLRHPVFRRRRSPLLVNFFLRLPSLADRMI